MRFLLHVATVIAILLSTASLPSIAEEVAKEGTESPYVVLERVGNNLFSRIATNQQEIKKFPPLMRTIVDEELMPVIDYRYAAYRILGKNLRKVSKEQREHFVAAIQAYLSRTYATALLKYKNQQVIFEQDKPVLDKRIVAVKTQIIEVNKPTIDLTFKLRKNKKTGQWKVFDMVIEGISLLSTKQAELNKRIAKQGIDQVTVELASIAK